jgi:hypothetical protein
MQAYTLSPPQDQPDRTTRKEHLESFYQKHSPSKCARVDQLVDQQTIGWNEMSQHLFLKYGETPAMVYEEKQRSLDRSYQSNGASAQSFQNKQTLRSEADYAASQPAYSPRGLDAALAQAADSNHYEGSQAAHAQPIPYGGLNDSVQQYAQSQTEQTIEYQPQHQQQESYAAAPPPPQSSYAAPAPTQPQKAYAAVNVPADPVEPGYQNRTDLEKYDADGDGKLDGLELLCKKYDTNGDGSFSMKEVEMIVEDMLAAKKEARNMGRVALGLFVLIILLAGAVFGLVFLGNEVSKENHTKQGVITDLDNNPAQTKSLESFTTLSAIPALPASILNTMTHLTFQGTQVGNTAASPSLFCITVQSWEKTVKPAQGTVAAQNKVTVQAAQGTLSLKSAGTIEFQTYDRTGQAASKYTVADAPATRRLTEHHRKTRGTVQLFPSMGHLKSAARDHHEATARERRQRQLQSGEGKDDLDADFFYEDFFTENGDFFGGATMNFMTGNYSTMLDTMVDVKWDDDDAGASAGAEGGVSDAWEGAAPVNDPNLKKTNEITYDLTMSGFTVADFAPSPQAQYSHGGTTSYGSVLEQTVVELLGPGNNVKVIKVEPIGAAPTSSPTTATTSGRRLAQDSFGVVVTLEVGSDSQAKSDVVLEMIQNATSPETMKMIEDSYKMNLWWYELPAPPTFSITSVGPPVQNIVTQAPSAAPTATPTVVQTQASGTTGQPTPSPTPPPTTIGSDSGTGTGTGTGTSGGGSSFVCPVYETLTMIKGEDPSGGSDSPAQAMKMQNCATGEDMCVTLSYVMSSASMGISANVTQGMCGSSLSCPVIESIMPDGQLLSTLTQAAEASGNDDAATDTSSNGESSDMSVSGAATRLLRSLRSTASGSDSSSSSSSGSGSSGIGSGSSSGDGDSGDDGGSSVPADAVVTDVQCLASPTDSFDHGSGSSSSSDSSSSSGSGSGSGSAPSSGSDSIYGSGSGFGEGSYTQGSYKM